MPQRLPPQFGWPLSDDTREELVPSTVSMMPKGLDETLTPQQIADMVAWLQTLKQAQ